MAFRLGAKLTAAVFLTLQLLGGAPSIIETYAYNTAPNIGATDYATDFYAEQFGFGVGPVGVAFDGVGNLFVADYPGGTLYEFPPGGGSTGSPGTRQGGVGLRATGLTFSNDKLHLYLARQGNCCGQGDVVEIDLQTLTVSRTVGAVPGATGLATDPLTGDIFASGNGIIARISNFATGPGTVSTYANVGADGITFGGDGTLYAAVPGGAIESVPGTNVPASGPWSGTLVATVLNASGQPAPVDGIGLGVGADPAKPPFIYVNRNDGVITKVDLTTSPPTTTDIVTGGTRGDLVTVSAQGCLFATQSTTIVKVTDAAGACNPPLQPPGSPPTSGVTPVAFTGGGSASIVPPYPCQLVAPVNCLTGEFWHRFSDLSINGRGLGLSLTRTYSSTLAAQDGLLGFGWTHSYNMALTFGSAGTVAVHEEGGSSITFSAAPSGGYAAPGWVVATLMKNADATFTLRRKNQVSFVFDASGRLISESDRNGHRTMLTYANGQLATVADSAGRQLQLQYSGNHLVKVVDPIGRSVSFQYDGAGNLSQATDAKGGLTKFAFDANHLLLSMTDPNGGVVSNQYDPTRRVSAQTDPLGRSTTWSYAAGTTTITDPKGNVVQETYQNGRLASITKGVSTPQAATSTMTYDPTTFALTSITDANGHLTKYAPDARGNVTSVTDALGHVTTFTYDQANNVTSATDPLGAATRLTYDSNGNVVTLARPVNASTKATMGLTYDAANAGDVTAVTDGDSDVWRFVNDQYGNITRAVDPLGNVTMYAYDLAGRLTASTNANGKTTTYTYDALNRLLTMTDPLGNKAAYQYDGNENVATRSDPNGHANQYSYDLANEPVKVVRSDGSQLRNQFDAAGLLAAQIDGLGNATSYGYDSLNRLVSATDALGRATTVVYDGAGNRSAITDAMGRKTSFSYDNVNELSSMAYSDAKTPAVSYRYDADGRRIGMTDGSGSTSYSYDQSGKLMQSVNGTRSVGYAYDLRGHLITLTYPDGSQVTRTYDAAGRLASVADWLGHRTIFGYDSDGNPVSQMYPNGTQETIGYDAANRLTQIGYSGPMGHITFTEGRNNGGQLTAENVVGEAPNGPIAYGYDAANRLSSANYGFASLAYQQNAADQLTQIISSSSAGSITSSLAYDAASQLASLTRTQGTRTLGKLQYSYDKNGNRTQTVDAAGAITNFAYDQANRLVGYADKAKYTYDGVGLRTSKTVAGVVEPFTWDISGRLPELIQDGVTRYVTGLDGLPLEQIASDGTVRYYHQDALGSTRALTSGDGRLDTVYAYDPYGNVTTFPGNKMANPFQFAGQYIDAESGLQYMRARYYEPATGQFITRDPLVAATRQAYAYANNDPVNRVDRTGLYWYQDTQYIGEVAGVGGAANVMGFLQQNLAAMFPFPTGDCTQVVLGAECTLQPWPFNLQPSDVTVTSVTATSFTFTTGTIHTSGPGATITFNTFELDGSVYLRETANAPNADSKSNLIDPFGAWVTWQRLADNLRQALTPTTCPPNFPFLIL